MDENALPRYALEQDGEYFYVRDNVRNERLPYESRNKAFVEGVLKRLLSDYAEYVERQSQEHQ